MKDRGQDAQVSCALSIELVLLLVRMGKAKAAPAGGKAAGGKGAGESSKGKGKVGKEGLGTCTYVKGMQHLTL